MSTYTGALRRERTGRGDNIPPPVGQRCRPRSWGSTGNSWETEFENCGNKLKAVTLEVPCGDDDGIIFVIRTVADEWVKNGDGDFYAHRDTDQLAPSPLYEHQQNREKRRNKKEHRDHDRKDRKKKTIRLLPTNLSFLRRSMPNQLNRSNSSPGRNGTWTISC